MTTAVGSNYRKWANSDTAYTLCVSGSDLYVAYETTGRPRSDIWRSDTGSRLIDALWCHEAAHNAHPADITGQCQALETSVGADPSSLRDWLIECLISESTVLHNEPHDLWGIVLIDGEEVYWCHTNGFSEWRYLSDCDSDLLALIDAYRD